MQVLTDETVLGFVRRQQSKGALHGKKTGGVSALTVGRLSGTVIVLFGSWMLGVSEGESFNGLAVWHVGRVTRYGLTRDVGIAGRLRGRLYEGMWRDRVIG